ncbi:hypothetical protein ACMD2_24308, partial [Ananas comosus]
GEQESEESKQSTADMTTLCKPPHADGYEFSLLWQAFLLGIYVVSLDEMGSRIDELEKSINDLKAEMETESGPKVSPQETKPADGSA